MNLRHLGFLAGTLTSNRSTACKHYCRAANAQITTPAARNYACKSLAAKPGRFGTYAKRVFMLTCCHTLYCIAMPLPCLCPAPALPLPCFCPALPCPALPCPAQPCPALAYFCPACKHPSMIHTPHDNPSCYQWLCINFIRSNLVHYSSCSCHALAGLAGAVSRPDC